MKTLKQKILNRDLTIGSWITMTDPAVSEIMSKRGFDWLTLDMEHSSLNANQAQEHIRTISLSGCVPLVRVMDHNPDTMKQFMDMGAHGLIVPRVNNAEIAQNAVNAVKYPPRGTRGVGLARAQGYSLDLASYIRWNQEQSVIIVQIEHIEAVRNIEKIMAVKDVDGFLIGPYDLSASLGRPGEFDHPSFLAALEEINTRSAKHGWLKGVHSVNPSAEAAKQNIKTGYKFVGIGTDFLFLGEMANGLTRAVKEL